ncbi:MAG: hypothetical protein M0R46_14135 [Candidatus Muirbacterium halophilum]|nr:hypothetical protein [Candidatus Muirbacterium halophilum]
MNIKKYKDFINENVEEIKLKYISDNIRYDLLKKTIDSDIIDSHTPSKKEITDSLWKLEGIFCYNRPDNTIEFYEYWVKSCYDGLYMKPEYKNLSKEEAIDLFMSDRFSLIAKKANCEVINYEFVKKPYSHDTLTIKMKKK